MDIALAVLSLVFAGLFYWGCTVLLKGIKKRYESLSLGLLLLASICAAVPGWAYLVLNDGQEIHPLLAAVVLGTLWTTAVSPYLFMFFLVSLGSSEHGDRSKLSS